MHESGLVALGAAQHDAHVHDVRVLALLTLTASLGRGDDHRPAVESSRAATQVQHSAHRYESHEHFSPDISLPGGTIPGRPCAVWSKHTHATKTSSLTTFSRQKTWIGFRKFGTVCFGHQSVITLELKLKLNVWTGKACQGSRVPCNPSYKRQVIGRQHKISFRATTGSTGENDSDHEIAAIRISMCSVKSARKGTKNPCIHHMWSEPKKTHGPSQA